MAEPSSAGQPTAPVTGSALVGFLPAIWLSLVFGWRMLSGRWAAVGQS